MKTFINVMALLAVTFPIVGQGTLHFRNAEDSLIRFSEGDPVPTDIWQVQLFWRRYGAGFVPWDISSMSPQDWLLRNQGQGWRLAGTPTKIGPEPGLFDGGMLTLETATPGQEIAAIVLAWPSSAKTFEGAASPYSVGISPMFGIDTGDPTADPPETPGTLTGSSWPFKGVLIPTLIPEPSAAALVAFLGAGLWMLKRRRHEYIKNNSDAVR